MTFAFGETSDNASSSAIMQVQVDLSSDLDYDSELVITLRLARLCTSCAYFVARSPVTQAVAAPLCC